MLLIFIFSSDEETGLVRMYPEVYCCDTTFGTNNEKKDLFTVAFLDGNKKLLNGARAYIPNEQRWMFHTLFKYCLPFFWGPSVRERMNLIMIDSCSKEFMSVIESTGDKSYGFPNAILGLCYWHLAVLGRERNVDGYVSRDGKNNKIYHTTIFRIKMSFLQHSYPLKLLMKDVEALTKQMLSRMFCEGG